MIGRPEHHLRPEHHPRPGTAAIVRSLVLGTAVFVIAALAGVLLAGAGSAAGPDPDGEGAAASAEHALGDGDAQFARSMVYSGTAALAVSVVGLVIVARRRRLW